MKKKKERDEREERGKKSEEEKIQHNKRPILALLAR